MDKGEECNAIDKDLYKGESPDQTWEKRRFKRYPADFLDIHGRILFSSGITIHNISVGGIAFSTDKKLLEGRSYALRLESKGRILNLMGTIMWCRSGSRNKENGNFLPTCTVGMQFVNLSSRQITELEHFIRDNFKDYQKIDTIGKDLNGIRLHVRFQIHDPERATLNYVEYFKVKRISQGGMLVESNYPLEVEDAVPMTMNLSDTKPVVFWGRIVTCHSLQGAEQRYEIGIEFTHISESDRTTLKIFIDSLEVSFR